MDSLNGEQVSPFTSPVHRLSAGWHRLRVRRHGYGAALQTAVVLSAFTPLDSSSAPRVQGAYRDDNGKPVVLDCVRKAEAMIAGNEFME